MTVSGISLRIWSPVSQRAHQLLRRASASNLFFKIRKALDEEKRRDRGHVEVVHQAGLVDIQAFQRRLVEDERWSLHQVTVLLLSYSRFVR
jgi:hypothetical protein